ncbi:GTP-binding protein [Candidatus Bathyarchaeota archaeon]|nr:GTP-binding protein [Candidatus Bathyarchaeota archaeon]
MGLFDIFRRHTNRKAVFVGLDNSGKSTFISFLQEGKFVEHTPTMGKRKSDMEIGGTRISLFDIGGQEDFRNMWLGELKSAKCVVFVIDKADTKRFQESRNELEKLLPTIKKNNITLLILANKHDLKEAASLGTVIKEFSLFDVENFEIIEISAKTGYGMADAFVKFYSILTGEKIKKKKLTKAISVFNHGGVPIISHVDDDSTIERKAIEGGFMVAISQFCNMKLGENEETNIIAFESAKNGTFLIAKSSNFIASLLWREDLEIPMAQTKDALKDLLEHLEQFCKESNEEGISFHVEHYITNLM